MLKPKNSSLGFWWICIAGAILGTVASQTLLDFFSILMFFGICFDLYQNKSDTLSRFRKIGPEWAFICYFVAVVLGFVVNSSSDAEVLRSISKFSWVLSLYVYIYAFSKVRLSVKGIILFLIFGFVLPNAYAIAGYVIKYDGLTRMDIKRAVGMVNSPTYHSHANAMLFVFFSAVFYFNFKKLSMQLKFWGSLFLFVFFVSIFVTFVRGIWISIFISTFMMFSLISFKKCLQIVISSLIIGLVTYAVWPAFHDRVNATTLTSASNLERKNLLKVNLQIFKEYPLLGIGYGENLRRNREYWDKPEWNMPQDYITSHAHNQYLNVLATTGIVGFLFFMSFMLFFFRENWRMLKAEANKNSFRYVLIFGCLWAQIEFFLACLTDVTFEYAKIRALYLMVWALLIAIRRHGNEIAVEAE